MRVNEFSIIKFIYFALFISSMYPWLLWGISPIFLSIFSLFACILLLKKGFFIKFSSNYIILSLSFLFLFLWLGKYDNVFGLVNRLINWGLINVLLFLKEDYKKEILKFITKYFSIILGISLLGYVLYLFGINLPYNIIYMANYPDGFKNYYLFITLENSYRFQSIFLEPGHMTMGLAPLLFLNRYDISNKYVLLLLLSQLFSFSLAGFLIFIIGVFFVIFKSEQNRKLIKVLTIILFFISFAFVSSYLLQENVFQKLILSRLEWNGSTIVGNNRSSQELDDVYSSLLLSNEKWTGIGWNSESYEHGVSGYKVFIVNYGIIGVFLCVFCYFMYIMLQYKSRYKWCFLFILLLLLYQNAYPEWWCVIIPFLCGLQYLSDNRRSLSLSVTI